MSEEQDVQDRGPNSAGKDPIDREQERHLSGLFSSLHLLSVKGSPLSFKQTLARAVEEAERFQRWQESGTPISDIVVRLSDGQEMELGKRMSANPSGLHFVTEFFPGAVMHIFKKGDMSFDEILLHSVRVDRIPLSGYSYKKKYLNKQSLMVKIERRPDGQFSVNVDFSEAGFIFGMKPQVHIMIPLLGPILLALVGIWYSLLRRRGHAATSAPQPSKAFAHCLTAIAILSVALSASTNWRQAEHNVADLPATSSASATLTINGTPAAIEAHQLPVVNFANHGFFGSRVPDAITQKGNSIDPKVLQILNETYGVHSTAGQANRSTKPVSALAGASPASCAVESSLISNVRSSSTSASTVANGYSWTTYPNSLTSVRKSQVTVYITAFAKDDVTLTAAMLKTFADALKSTTGFIVVTDLPPDTPADYRVDLWFERKVDCHGRILAELYDARNNYIDVEERDCHDYPKGQLLTNATQQIAASLFSKIVRQSGETAKVNGVS